MPRTVKPANADDSGAPDRPGGRGQGTAGKTYHQLRTELDEVVDKLQDPDCDVDEAAGLYEQALRLIQSLEQRLERADNRVRKIHADFNGESAED